jgi:spermidine synthase
MKWFFEKYIQPSEKNGPITVRRWFGKWSIYVDGYDNTSPYLQKIWQTLFEKFTISTERTTVKNILMLGLGAGGEIKTLYKLFPRCKITVVEYDQTMIALAKKMALYKPFPAPHIIYADAAEAVLQLSGHYNIIIIDIFKGIEPSPLSCNKDFLKKLHSLLSDNGFLFVNIFKKRVDYLEPAQKVFRSVRSWTYEYNTFGILQK